MKICVFMSDYRLLSNIYDTANYNSLTASINYEYCKKYNYNFIYYRPYNNNIETIDINNCIDPNTNLPRHFSWSKLLSCLKTLKLEYDYVVYINSDCIFKNFNISIEKFIEKHINKNITFLNNKPWGDHYPCSGFFICKNNNISVDFIKEWFNFNIPEKNTQHTYEQEALWRIYQGNDIGIINSWMFREEADQFLRIIGNHENNNRIPYFKNYIKLNNIDFNNIDLIKCINYNTNDTPEDIQNNTPIIIYPFQINIFIVCYNESVILPHTVAHYKKNLPSCKITIYDNYSTDNSVEIAKSLGCEVIMWNTNNIIDDWKLRDLKNNCWKILEYGWVFMIDMDEWVNITEDELKMEFNNGTTVLNIIGLDMIGESKLTDLSDINLHEIKKYVNNNEESKKLCFLREKIKDMNYECGAHKCYINGRIKYSTKSYINKHMCNLGLTFYLNRILSRHNRSHKMRSNGLAGHYINNIEKITLNYNSRLQKSKLLN